MMRFKTSLEPNVSLIDLTALVDVIFLMLIFFIIASDILPLKSLNIDNPPLQTTSSPRTTQILVVMDADNVIYVGSKKEIVDFDSFQKTLQREITSNKNVHGSVDSTIVLSVDKRVDYGNFLRLFSEAQQTGVKLRLVYKEICSTTP